MRRFHLIEVLDQAWCPADVRDAVTDYLQFSISLNNPYQAVLPRLAEALRASHADWIVDLCAGAGGPWGQLRPALERMLARPLALVLTDRFPHRPAAGASASDRAAPAALTLAADARALPIGAPVFRTIFAGFHHFAPPDARAILQDALRQRHGIGIFEATQRRLPAMALVALSAASLLVTTPFIRPWRWSRLLWTYVVPLVPLVLVFDGVVSCLRTYTPDEMRDLVGQLDAQDYVWQIGEAPIPGTPLAVTYAIGYPRAA